MQGEAPRLTSAASEKLRLDEILDEIDSLPMTALTQPAAAPASYPELVWTRLIAAPRDKLFKAWTQPELLMQGSATFRRDA